MPALEPERGVSLADSLAATPATRKGPACAVARIEASLGPDEAAYLEQQLALDDPYMAGRLSAALKAEGYTVSADTLRRHKRGVCVCP
jgi:hypothetical protein